MSWRLLIDWRFWLWIWALYRMPRGEGCRTLDNDHGCLMENNAHCWLFGETLCGSDDNNIIFKKPKQCLYFTNHLGRWRFILGTWLGVYKFGYSELLIEVILRNLLDPV